jgi:hypothetical protein
MTRRDSPEVSAHTVALRQEMALGVAEIDSLDLRDESFGAVCGPSRAPSQFPQQPL